MKIATHVTERVMHQWPPSYWLDLFKKLTSKGHEVYVYSGESNVHIQMKNDKVFDRSHLTDEQAIAEIASCDLFIGPLLHFYRAAEKANVRTIGILTSSLNGSGVKAEIPCAGCLESLGDRMDCHWRDELCQWHVTPQMVMGAI